MMIKRYVTLFLVVFVISLFKASAQLIIPQPDLTVLQSADTISSLPYQNQLYKSRLDSIKKTVPLSYNDHVQKYIDLYAGRSMEIAKVIGLSRYYFPIFDKSLKEYNVPEEIKFLSIVESSLDPLAVSRSGATGPWQFMFNTAKVYGLNIDSYVDERRDPVNASLAAAHYLKNAFEQLGDWLLAIAAYNCGEGAVSRAVKKAGVADFWAIRQYLPVQTQNYVPAFIATTYIMNYYSAHGILPDEPVLPLSTDLILVDKFVSFSAIANAIDVDIKSIARLNPRYKQQMINGSEASPKPLILPYFDHNKYGNLYEVLTNKDGYKAAQFADTDNRAQKTAFRSPGKSSPSNTYLTYKVKAGDTLSQIAEKFKGSTVSDIKSHNRLKSSYLQPGKILKISKG